MMRLEPQGVRNVLAVKLSSLGDIVHVTPCLRALRRQFPLARIVLAVDSRFAALVRHDPHLDGLIESEHLESGWISRTLATGRSLRRPRLPFDLAIDFQGVRRSALYVYLSRARVQVGRGGLRPGWAAVLRPDPSRHAVEVCADVARAAGITVPDLAPFVQVSPTADAELATILTTAGLPPSGFLVVNPFARWRSKEWPLERYAQLLRLLRQDRHLPVVLSGSADRIRSAARLQALLADGRAVSLVGRLSLGQAVALYRRATVLVTGDSGPMHIAAAVGTKLVALFGPTFPERTGPWGQSHRVIQRKRPPSHHAYRTDRGREYMCAIDVATVYRAVSTVLDEIASCRPAASHPAVGLGDASS